MPDSPTPRTPHEQPLPESNDSVGGASSGAGEMRVPQTEVVLRHGSVELARAAWPPGEYVIGRAAEADLRGDAPLLSGQHARLTINYDHVLLEDLGSSNGTFVAEQAITECTRLFPNQAIRLGDVKLEIRRQRAASTPDMSLAPAQAAIRQLIPDEVLAHKRYAIGQQVARGGMGAILDAQQAAMKRHVAMKVMLEGNDAGDVARFVDEAQITGQLEHPNIVPVHELGVDENDQLFYTMKFVRGITLKKVLELLEKGVAETMKKYPLPALLTIFQKTCDAIAFAHSKGVIHRDLKPENLMLGDFGEVLVMDWGLAKVVGTAKDEGGRMKDEESSHRGLIASARGSAPEFGNTMAGTILGTPAYMAPEQARGEVETMDQRADIYSLGAILFEILHLRPPLTGNDPWAIVDKAQRGEIEWTGPAREDTRPAIPASLLAVCGKALALDPAQRYPHVADLQADLAAYQNGFATSAENAGTWKQLALFIKRNKAASIGAAAVVLVGATFGTKAIVEGRRAEREAAAAKAALASLRATAPTFRDQATLLTAQEKLPEALEKIDIALTLNPTDSSFHAQRGNVLQSMERFAEAAESYAAALRLNPQEPNAAANVELSRALAADAATDGALPLDRRMRWRDALIQQGRPAEAIIAGRSLTSDAGKMLPAWQAKLNAWLGKDAPQLKLSSDGLASLDLKGRSLTDLSPIRGMPIRNLHLEGNPELADIGPLADCPIIELYAGYLRKLVDLSPLKGKNLRAIYVGDTGVRDLRPLAGMKELSILDIVGDAVGDLTPIREARLKSLSAHASGVHDLEPLRGQPLEVLSVSYHSIDSLEPVGDAPLRTLGISRCGHLDLAHLRTRRLQTLSADGTILDHLEVLAEMTELRTILLPKNLTDPGILRKLPHLAKIGTDSGKAATTYKDAADFWREYDAKKGAGEVK